MDQQLPGENLHLLDLSQKSISLSGLSPLKGVTADPFY